MEIQNTQSGQAFASTSTVAPVRNDSPLTSEQSSNRSEQQSGDQNQFANSVKQVQVEAAGRQAEVNKEVADNAGKLKEQMESLATNLSSLNGVYGGMLSAMNKR